MLMDGFYVSVPTSSYASTSTQDIILYCVRVKQLVKP